MGPDRPSSVTFSRGTVVSDCFYVQNKQVLIPSEGSSLRLVERAEYSGL